MRSRGSAMLLSLILVAAITTVIVANAGLTTAALKNQTRYERQRAAQYAFDGAVEQVAKDFAKDALTLPSTRSVTIGNVVCDLSINPSFTVSRRSLKVDGTMSVKGTTWSMTRYVGARHAPSPFYYSLAVNADKDFRGVLTTGSGGQLGDVGANGRLKFKAGGSVNGDLDTTTAPTMNGVTVTGVSTVGIDPIVFPTPSNAAYSAAADTTLWFSWLVGRSFGAPGTYYPLHYRSGDLTIQGVFSGKGTIYVTGSVTIVDDMFYADANSELVIIADSFTTNASVWSLVGYFYCRGRFQTGSGGTTTLSRGAIACGDLDLNGPLNVTYDPFVWLDPNAGRKLRLPGFWP